MDFGSLPARREVPVFVKRQDQRDLALKLVKIKAGIGNAGETASRKERDEADSLARQLGLLVHKKRFVTDDPFVKSLRQLLRNQGIVLVTHEGEEVTEELEEEVDIVEWLPPGDEEAERVVDALEPEIRRNGRLLHRAKLSCRQGNLPDQEEDVLPAPGNPEENEKACVNRRKGKSGGRKKSRKKRKADAKKRADEELRKQKEKEKQENGNQ